MENELSRTLSVAGAKVQYDTMVKRVLSNKIVLAWILRSIIKEYENMSLEEVKSYIEGEPQVGEIPVNPGETNGDRITGTNTEDAVPNEGKVTYDIRFHTYLPGKKEKVKLKVEEKKKILQKEYGISMEKSMEQEVHDMCNLSDWVYDQGVRSVVINMLKDGNFTDEKIMMLAGISKEDLQEVKESLYCA